MAVMDLEQFFTQVSAFCWEKEWENSVLWTVSKYEQEMPSLYINLMTNHL
jgi:hypothetical protein